ncbi:hypothetical protein PHYPSEUDO_002651 [Phytophthora pseudosyringae]|uniref:M96 mating-specific protein family n=1 Tax=Phytophthora pseudosyringae TaxID=221518 RepID=A0A8T1VWW7_9STRA|nr:hypothetical protein PHYPSEUDO_002651 [Phytophthora pseudosyringae]
MESVNAALSDEALQLPGICADNAAGYFSSLGGDEWDPEVLLGAMDGDIGDFDTELQPATPSQRVHAPTADTAFKRAFAEHKEQQRKKKKKKINYDPNKARNERRFKLLELRDEVSELEMKLKQLQIIRNERLVDRPMTDRGLLRVMLKKSCEREMQVVEGLTRLLYKHPSQRDIVYLGENVRTRRIEIPTGCLKHMAALIFDELWTGVENSYRVVEVVVEVNSPVPMNQVTQKPLLRDAMNGMCMEVFDHHILPFNMRETVDAWWKYWNNYRGQHSEANVGNAVTESFGLEFTDVLASTTATFYVQQILRRYIEGDRTVIIWNAYIEPFMFENERVNGVYFLEQSHVLIKPVGRSSTDPEDTVSTRMSTCEIVTPHFLEPTLKHDPKMAALTDFVVNSLSSNIMMRNEKVEDLLLDQMLHRHRDG